MSTSDPAMSRSFPKRSRPILVWVICLYYAFGFIVASVSLYAIFSGVLPLPTDVANFYRSFDLLKFTGVGLSAVLAPIAIVQLFRLQKIAPIAVSALFVVTFTKTLWFLPDIIRLGSGPTMSLVAVGINFLIVFYTWHLRVVGILR